LYSTRGEIALAEHQWDEAESWFKRGLAETEHYGNLEQAANYRANLGLAARGRGDLDSALTLLETARTSAAGLTAPHLQTQIDLWLAELYLERGERAAAGEALARAEARLAGGERKRLTSQMSNLKSQIDRLTAK
jgi:ATP/maltotriose-dependent transcriptional regulator MalT